MKATVKINGIEREIELTEEQAKVFRGDDGLPFAPEFNEKYYVPYSESCHANSFTSYDEVVISCGLAFRTKKSANKERAKMEAMFRIRKNAAEKYPFVPDWKDCEKEKHYISFSHETNTFMCSFNPVVQSSLLPFFSRSFKCVSFIKENEEDLRTVFGIS